MKPGTQAGNYIIEKALSESDRVHVYLVRHAELNTKHLLKALPPKLAEDEELRQGKLEESRVLMRVQHRNIVPVSDVVATPEVVGLVREIVDGLTLDEFLRQNPNPSMPLIRGLFVQLLDAIACVHLKDLLHGNIKPSNILISQNRSGNPVLRVADFAMAKLFEADYGELRSAGQKVVLDMDSEGFVSKEGLDFSPDILSLGVLLYEMICGDSIFEGKSEQEIKLAITEDNHHLLENMPPEHRAAFADIFEGLQSLKKVEVTTCLTLLWELKWKDSQEKAAVVKARWNARDPIPKSVKSRLSEDMVYNPGGSFVMGSGNKREGEALLTKATLSPYYLGRNLVTVAEYRLAVEAGACEVPEDASFNWADPELDQHPINGVSWLQAAAYCEWRGGRLPTEAEWEYAATGGDERIFPWGDEPPENRACWDGAGNDAGKGKRSGTQPVGSYPLGASPFGLLDMAGNVYEWIADWYAESLPGGSVINPRGPASGRSCVLRGGSWVSYHQKWLHSRKRSWDRPDYADAFTGFRCVWEA